MGPAAGVPQPFPVLRDVEEGNAPRAVLGSFPGTTLRAEPVTARGVHRRRKSFCVLVPTGSCSHAAPESAYSEEQNAGISAETDVFIRNESGDSRGRVRKRGRHWVGADAGVLLDRCRSPEGASGRRRILFLVLVIVEVGARDDGGRGGGRTDCRGDERFGSDARRCRADAAAPPGVEHDDEENAADFSVSRRVRELPLSGANDVPRVPVQASRRLVLPPAGPDRGQGVAGLAVRRPAPAPPVLARREEHGGAPRVLHDGGPEAGGQRAVRVPHEAAGAERRRLGGAGDQLHSARHRGRRLRPVAGRRRLASGHESRRLLGGGRLSPRHGGGSGCRDVPPARTKGADANFGP
mmetsp:Transcript_1326/g.2972  ORF Transcript_1326/g.2972 Transcript_1326/m.2972 type:complete len:352 (-) Transcript_1326:1757-2812(-)